jgi:hypothetical protein
MIDLRVPTVDTSVQIFRADGQEMVGRIFLPAVAETHEGPVRIEEWANGAGDFFPFHADGEAAPVILGKAAVLAFGSEAAGEEPVLEFGGLSTRRVTVECGGHCFTGIVVIDLPDFNQRVLDCMNQPQPFLRLRAGARECLIQKRYITRVTEEQQ